MTMPRLLTVLVLCHALAAPAAWAQEPPPEGEPETGRRYAVEVIIFEYTELDSVGTEVFVPERLPEAADGGLPEAGTGVRGDAPPEPPAPADARYRPLAEDELAMTDLRNMLVRLQAYEPLMHFGWVQETLPEAVPPTLPLERFGTPPDGLSGSLTLSLSRFLHLGVDLELAAGEPYVPPRPAGPPGAGAGANGPESLPETPARYAPLVYALEETRIIRSGETRYYDHPHFGVIARVTRVDGAASGDPGEVPAPGGSTAANRRR